MTTIMSSDDELILLMRKWSTELFKVYFQMVKLFMNFWSHEVYSFHMTMTITIILLPLTHSQMIHLDSD